MARREMTDFAFRRFLIDQGFVIVDIFSRGNCLYRSIALAVYGNANLQHLVREDLFNEITHNREAYEAVYGSGADFEQELAGIQVNRVWGSELSIVAASNAYQVNISVYLPTGNVVHFPTNRHFASTVFLSFHTWNHYNLLLRPEGNVQPSRRDNDEENYNSKSQDVVFDFGD